MLFVLFKLDLSLASYFLHLGGNIMFTYVEHSFRRIKKLTGVKIQPGFNVQISGVLFILGWKRWIWMMLSSPKTFLTGWLQTLKSMKSWAQDILVII